MSAVGKKIWLYMQEHDPPYNRRSLATKWKKDGTFPISAQSVSNYLYRKNPPPEFVNAVVKEFNLNLEQELELHWLYFHGGERGPAVADIIRASEVEQEATADAKNEKR